ncbi:hypothetical protein QTN24_17585 [Cupriavidus sp. SZY C1]|uniref:hypothetical protein n=1 Tax=Cupriavidus sp. SZY C1 TaxID=3055037 RepID=UPI0028B752E7|nr:hypothetical protein [Cupriavidus sp. SZY C1]MDT6963314.1 hypothetical protein [Cupriavidus sp. SZY C1]
MVSDEKTGRIAPPRLPYWITTDSVDCAGTNARLSYIGKKSKNVTLRLGVVSRPIPC